MYYTPYSIIMKWPIIVLLLVCYPTTLLCDDNNETVKVKYLHVLSQIQSRFAITLITSEVVNLANVSNEVSFNVRLPESAFISNFSMKIRDQLVLGNVKEKEKAKTEYVAAVKAGKSAGLIAEKPRETNAFDISVNVEPFGKVVFNLTYQEMLKRTHGVYKQIINLTPQQQVDNLAVDVLINEQGEITKLKVPEFGDKVGEKTNRDLLNMQDEQNVKTTSLSTRNYSYAYITYVPPKTGNITAGQLVVLYDVKRDDNAGEIEVMNGYFVHFFAPTDLPKGQKTVAFVLDKSGSMIGRKFQQTQDAMKTVLKQLDKIDQFNILMFANNVEVWKPKFVQATEENVNTAIQYVQDSHANGGTNIMGALSEACNLLTRSESNSLTSMIIFLTDGEATVGETNNDAIVNRTSLLNQNTNFVIHSLAFGTNADFKLVQRISSQNKGLARKVYEDSDAELQLTGFFDEISSPLLTNVNIRYLNETVDIESLVQDGSYNYYQGGEFVVVGKLTDPEVQNPLFDAEISAKSQSGSVGYRAMSKIISCPRENVIVEGDIMVPCCIWPRCPVRPPTRPPPVKKPLLPSTTIGGFIERIWAYQTIKKLLKSSEIETSNKERYRQKALELSLKYQFVTQLTSMVVVQPDQENATVLEEYQTQKNERDRFHGVAGRGGSMSFRSSGVSNKWVHLHAFHHPAGAPGAPPPTQQSRLTSARPATTTTTTTPQRQKISCFNETSLLIYVDLSSADTRCANAEFVKRFLTSLYSKVRQNLTVDVRIKTVNDLVVGTITRNGSGFTSPLPVNTVLSDCSSVGPQSTNVQNLYTSTSEATTADVVLFVVADTNSNDFKPLVESLQQKKKKLVSIVNLNVNAENENSLKMLSKVNYFARPDSYNNLVLYVILFNYLC